MDDMKILCSLIVTMLDGYSEGMLENSTLTLSFDCEEYHYECNLKRTVNDGDTNEES